MLVQLPYDRVDFVWVKSHYDIHLEGLCKYNGELHRFKVGSDFGYDEGVEDYILPIMNIYKLNRIEKFKWLCRKKLFEICVGKHFTYPYRKNGVRFYTKSPKWFWSKVFKLYYWKQL